ncbi:MAG: hypothetical protein IKL52_03485 [Candidatus Gastranaerophilales bacterium]|jgi:hypothetical protein|nr:hypothetical protein [Candidatus Gastranaerophilales bacterium]
MSEVISKILKIKSPMMPPSVNFIEQEIIKNNIEPLRWAIVEVASSELTISVSGRKLN